MNTPPKRQPPLFPLGQIVATPGAFEALAEAGQTPWKLLQRHQTGDWGEAPPEDQQENDFSVQHDLRILSAYTLTTGVKLWLITEWDRSYTTLLLPSEY